MLHLSAFKLPFSLLLIWITGVASYNILGIFPFPGRSHYIAFDGLMVGLAERGHNVTVYNTFLKPYSLPNYTEVDLTKCFTLPNILTLEQMISIGTQRVQTGILLSHMLPSEEEIMNCQPLLDLRNSTQSYDLIVTETFNHDFTALFGHVLKAPVIVFHSAVVFPWMSVHAGAPENPSYIVHPYLRHAPTTKLNFRDRIMNVLLYLHSLYFYKFQSENVFDKVAAKFFGPHVPPIAEAVRNASLLFVNAHHSFNGNRPLTPNVIEVGGINIKPAKPLPKDIEKFINESTHGVIYFCMGSLLRGSSFPKEKRDAFLHAFAKLPQRVLWKWEADELPQKSDTIMISKWMPQRDVLAHPNVKVFITHGGLLGTSEAVYEGVPVLGIPIFADQKNNIENMKANGAGELLDYGDISKEAIFEKLSRLLNNPEYKKNALDLSRRFKDRPMSPMDTGAYWVEYVIRHRGASHLKSVALHMPWYQYLLLDVLAFALLLSLSALVILYCSIKITFRFISILLGSGNPTNLQTKIKKN